MLLPPAQCGVGSGIYEWPSLVFAGADRAFAHAVTAVRMRLQLLYCYIMNNIRREYSASRRVPLCKRLTGKST